MNIVHISMFYLTDPDKADAMMEALNQIEYAGMVSNVVGKQMFTPPQIENGPDFADVVQIIAFADKEAADAYPVSPAHDKLREQTDDFVARVAGIDFEH